MKDKSDDLKGRAKDTVFEKVDETQEEAAKRRSDRISGSSSDILSSIRTERRIRADDLGDLDDFEIGDLEGPGDSDFSFVPEKQPKLAKEPDNKSVESSESVSGPVSGAEEDLPFGESEPVSRKEVSVVPAVASQAAGSSRPVESKKSRVEVPFGESVDVKLGAKSRRPQNSESVRKQKSASLKEEFKKSSVSQSGSKSKIPSQVSEKDEKSKVAASDAIEELSPSKKETKAEEMEVIPPNEEKTAALSQVSEPTKAVSKWAFWKRPSRRDEQLERISDGYLEMVDLVRAIRGQLESQNENNLILRDSLAHLPKAMEGLDSFSNSQREVGEALHNIHGQIQRSGDRDDKLVDSMDGFNTTLQGLDVTNQATLKTFDRVRERMNESDTRIENLFENAQETEGRVSDTMVRLQKNMAIMQGIFLFCLLAVITVLVFIIIDHEKEPKAQTPDRTELVQPNDAPSRITPREAREVTIPLTND